MTLADAATQRADMWTALPPLALFVLLVLILAVLVAIYHQGRRP